MNNGAHPTRQALMAWGIFLTLNIILNGTIPFVLGTDLRAWIGSLPHAILFSVVQYAIMFTVVPLLIIKGWKTIRQPGFLLPLSVAVAAISLALVYRGVMAIAILALAYLHRRFDLSEYGIQSRGWRGDLVAIVSVGILYSIPSLLQTRLLSSDPGGALAAGLDRLFANPASSVENLFYFGFLTERLSLKTGRWLTPILIGMMYAAHEMSNPEYWYANMNFLLVFIGAMLLAYIYLWRRGVIAIWLGDGLGRILTRLL